MHPLPSIRRNSHQRQSALIWVCFSRHEPPTGYISVPDSKQTRMQTIIHAGPRQHKWFGTENVLNHTSNTSLTHMNESLVSVVLTLALEPLFPKAPVKTKKASQRKCINSEQQVQCWHGLLVRSHHPSTHPSIHPSEVRGHLNTSKPAPARLRRAMAQRKGRILVIPAGGYICGTGKGNWSSFPCQLSYSAHVMCRFISAALSLQGIDSFLQSWLIRVRKRKVKRSFSAPSSLIRTALTPPMLLLGIKARPTGVSGIPVNTAKRGFLAGRCS